MWGKYLRHSQSRVAKEGKQMHEAMKNTLGAGKAPRGWIQRSKMKNQQSQLTQNHQDSKILLHE